MASQMADFFKVVVLFVAAFVFAAQDFQLCAQTPASSSGSDKGSILDEKFVRAACAYFDYDRNGSFNPSLEDFGRLIELADSGNADAQFVCGVCYFHGLRIPQDFEKAAFMFSKSAFAGNAFGQYGLGICLLDGRGISKDEKAAFGMFEKAAAAGLACASNMVGVCKYSGRGARPDAEGAVKLFKKAADGGCVRAKVSLGRARVEGLRASMRWPKITWACFTPAGSGVHRTTTPL